MFENEIAINLFQLENFDKVVRDLPEESLFRPAVGHGHPPAWIMGHLAIAGEMGQRMLGGSISHAGWLRLFGPGSSDRIEPDNSLTKSVLATAVVESYDKLRTLAVAATAESMNQPHKFALLQGTPLKTVGHLTSQLLTNHFGFHLSQLSSCRRSGGHAALF